MLDAIYEASFIPAECFLTRSAMSVANIGLHELYLNLPAVFFVFHIFTYVACWLERNKSKQMLSFGLFLL